MVELVAVRKIHGWEVTSKVSGIKSINVNVNVTQALLDSLPSTGMVRICINGGEITGSAEQMRTALLRMNRRG